ncbi:MAG: hypothetical protein AAFV54_02075, partial [Pseudomonadota bacterium]
PVQDLVYDTIINVLKNNNHIIAEGEDALLLSVVLKDFRSDLQPKSFTINCSGLIDARLRLVTDSSDVIYDEEFSVYYAEETVVASNSFRERIMNGALAKLGQEIQNSSALQQALIDHN